MGNNELHIVYSSQLAPDRDCEVFAPICRSARLRNAEHGVAGVLLFDGQRFLQWLHGPRDAVAALMCAIRSDPRHRDVVVHGEAMLPTTGLAADWRSGFIDAEALDAFVNIRSDDGGRMLDKLSRLIDQADLEPPVQAKNSRG